MSNEAIQPSDRDKYKRGVIEILSRLPDDIFVEVKYPGMEQHFPEPIIIEPAIVREMAEAWLYANTRA
jgi:hypothetical protein